MFDESAFEPSIDETVRRRFEEAWRSGCPYPIEDALADSTATEHIHTLEELVLIELEFAWKEARPVARDASGELRKPLVEDYLGRFPELNEHSILARLVEQEYNVRRRHGDAPSTSEFVQRFPTVVSDDDAARRLLTIREDGRQWPSIEGYEILGMLGRGGMGVVYKACHTQLNRVVAIKTLLSGPHAGPDELQRFRSEAEVVARLQHPNIVQVHDFGEHDGQPFFALEYVGGGTLARRIGNTPQGAEFSAATLVTLSRAIQTANATGIIHRDLKPSNVLLTPDGTLKVGDFGLARRLESDGHTATGAVLGTPGYMAPEQAAGRSSEVAGTTDVYGLGAILYHMLTGSPPFRGETQHDIVNQVIEAEPVAPRRLQPRVPQDLETICLKCLHKDPSRRYPTANELADDLERFLSGRPILARPVGAVERAAKWMRRRPALASLIAVSTLALLTITVGSAIYSAELKRYSVQLEDERNEAREARDAAHRSARVASEQAQLALSTLRSVVFDIQRELKGRMGMQYLRQRLLDKARSGLDRVAVTAQTSASADYVMATALVEIGEIYQIVGRTDEALDFIGRGLILFQQLERDAPDDLKLRHAQAAALSSLGGLHRTRGDSAAAVSALERSLEIRRRIMDSHRGDQENGRRLARILLDLAAIYSDRGQSEVAMDSYDESLELLIALSQADEDNIPVQEDLATAYNERGIHRLKYRDDATGRDDIVEAVRIRESLIDGGDPDGRLERQVAATVPWDSLGQAHVASGDLTAATEVWRKSLAVRREWAEQDPFNVDAKQSLAVSLRQVGDTLRDAGDPAGARLHYDEALTICRELSDSDPSNAAVASHLSASYGRMAAIDLELGDLTAARRAVLEAVRIYTELSKLDQLNLHFRRDLVSSGSELIAVLTKLGELDRVLQLATDNVEHAVELTRADPANVALQRVLVGTYEDLGDVHRRLGHAQQAADASRKCLDAAIAASRQNPDSEASLNLLDVAWDRMGDDYLEMREFARAQESYERAMEISKTRSERNPDNASARRYVALSHEKLARLFLASRQLELADQQYDAYDAILSELVAAHPTNAVFLHEAAVGRNLHGDLKRQRNDAEGAIKFYQSSRDAAEAFLSAYSDHADAMTDMAVALDKLAIMLGSQQQSDEQIRLMTEAVYYRRQALTARPDNVDDATTLSSSLILLGRKLLAKNQPQEALKHFQESLTIRQQCLGKRPDELRMTSNVGFAFLRVGEAQSAIGNTSAAREAFKSSVDAFQRVVDDSPVPKQQQRLVVALFNLAQLEFDCANYTEATRQFEKAHKLTLEFEEKAWSQEVSTHLEMSRSAPLVLQQLDAVDAVPPELVTPLLVLRSKKLIAEGHHAETATTADRLAKLRSDDPAALFQSARAYGHCARLVPETGGDEPQEARKRYIAKAIKMLDRARTTGYLDGARRESLKSDEAFAVVRQSDAWKSWIQQTE